MDISHCATNYPKAWQNSLSDISVDIILNFYTSRFRHISRNFFGWTKRSYNMCSISNMRGKVFSITYSKDVFKSIHFNRNSMHYVIYDSTKSYYHVIDGLSS